MADDPSEDIAEASVQRMSRVIEECAFPNVKKPINSRRSDQRKTKPCFYFVSYGFCRYGRDCKFFHPRPRTTGRTYNNRVFVNSRYSTSKVKPARRASFDPLDYKVDERGTNSRWATTDGARNEVSKRRAFSVGAVTTIEGKASYVADLNETCSLLENVALHSGEINPIPESNDNNLSILHEEASSSSGSAALGSISKNLEPRFTFQFLKFRKVHDLNTLSDDQLNTLRRSEITYLERRFPKHKVIENDSKYVVECTYSEHPDRLYDGKPCILRVKIGERYPHEVCEIEFVEEKHVLPSLLKTLNKGIKVFLTERHKSYLSSGKVELVLSAFVKWLDVSFDDMCNESLKKNSDEVLNETQLGEAKQECTPQTTSNDSGELSSDSASNRNGSYSRDERRESFHYTSSEPEDNNCDQQATVGQVTNWIKSGTEVKLIYFELRESAAALECSKITVMIRCGRCKTLCEVSVQAKHNWKSQCTKCHQNMSAIFHPVLLHPYSSVLGYLHLTGSHAVDLAFVQCRFLVTCLNCSKRCTIDGIHFGKPHVTWCTFCNHKFSITAEAAKFHELSPAQNNAKVSHSASSTYESSKKKSRDPAFKEGKPLPNNGACKHYKKSHRWLRFPCCGKAYPCDLCHEENEDGHEMKFASRMICGFCSKEQPYGKDRPCVSCVAMLTKKSAAHWEGGRGCRDKIKMCRDDKHKYTGVSKTTSRKCGSNSPKKKKA